MHCSHVSGGDGGSRSAKAGGLSSERESFEEARIAEDVRAAEWGGGKPEIGVARASSAPVYAHTPKLEEERGKQGEGGTGHSI